jgi:hypothetical protein
MLAPYPYLPLHEFDPTRRNALSRPYLGTVGAQNYALPEKQGI